ncbi:sugar/nucleoside kinase (ribokinase family) [Agromyces hippuratus]|uniref:Sugar/nucleoside kinase (Ribokinase family) n=1 Tax=Agromyces hippuratus TaxID=286438 RepID=A0A852X4U4_9MICO|nr:PfkB family carbohydrate kinase [Agromyces hippuratus]NYG22534.1 sugar/nucleoside kinase (ribokinase family) [Agromyces hippuratus]
MTERAADDVVDVLLAGPVFFDLIFTELNAAPRPGTEVHAGALASSPGGVANLAVATARLGLGTALATTVGDDVYGRWCWEFLADHEGIDLSSSQLVPNWPTPVTVSIASGGDRSMITREEASPLPAGALVGDRLAARATFADLGAMSRGARADDAWWQPAAHAGTKIFADIGWDSSERWDTADLQPLADCFAFTPNESEAMAYTRTQSAVAAARALAGRVPLVVVTRGDEGAVAIDSARGEEVIVPAVPAKGRDATGAGDVFGASLVLGTLRDWPLEQSLSFAALCAALAVEHPGGALAAPGWGDLADWWDRTRSDGDRELVARFSFLADVLPETPGRRRSESTFPFADYRATAARRSFPDKRGTS